MTRSTTRDLVATLQSKSIFAKDFAKDYAKDWAKDYAKIRYPERTS